MQRKVKTALVAGLLAVLFASVAYGAVLEYYGRIRATVDVKQSVLVDGETYNVIIDDVISEGAPGGERFCFKHWLKNRASVPANVTFKTTYKPSLTDKEIITEIYGLPEHTIVVTEGHEGWAEPVFDFTRPLQYKNDTYFGWDPLVLTKKHTFGCKVEFIIEVPQGMENGTQENFWAEIDADNDSTADWQFSFHSNLADHYPKDYWSFRENGEDGWGPHIALPSWIVGENIDWKKFKITIDSDRLGNDNGRADDCGLPYGFALFAVEGDEGFPESWPGECVVVDVKNARDYFIVETLGTLVEDTLTIPAKGKVLICICYNFRIDIMPGTYTITTKVVPA